MPPPRNVGEFLDMVRKSELLDAGPLDRYVEDLRARSSFPETPERLAKALVRDGFLTFYQAEQLLTGRWRSFYLGGKYKVLERLGSGGMASVFLCEHRVMRRLVALKVLPGVGADDPHTLARFHREARAAAQLNHPNIVHAHDVDQHGKLHFMVMEYVDGNNLEQLVKAHGPMDPLRASHYIRQAAQGLQHAHEAGLIHRDIKPANLLLDAGGTIKLLDLGLARFAAEEGDGLTRRADSHLILGTLDYLAPEQALDSHDVDIRADIYSLGATFYFLLTGRGLFHDASSVQKLTWHQTQRPTPIRELRPDLPAGLGAIIDRMLAREPAGRFQTPAEVVNALAPWTRTPIPPPPPETLTRLSPVARSTVRKQASLRIPVPYLPPSSFTPAPPAPAPVAAARPGPDPGAPRAARARPASDLLAAVRQRPQGVAIAALGLLAAVVAIAAWWVSRPS